MSVPTDDSFEASALGTKEYWDHVYDRENNNFKELGDIGEVWFGEDSVDRMICWVLDQPDITTSTSTLDLGCGNGHLLLGLADQGDMTDLTGIDYSASAIQLAKAVAQDQDRQAIVYATANFLQPDEECSWRPDDKTFGLVLDKGTFDAISLDPAQAQAQAEHRPGPRDAYVEAVRGLMQRDGKFLITSCNWTMDELIDHFKPHFQYHSHVKYPTFSFGGHTGSKICTVAFVPV
ncbi:S-adenosyl-L-methionine-dependent methyltransferase [Hesseltinella vesiculosa]|uniref:Protein-lysine N-methyltransferase EFM4 n=1 Tax=Hesseltinella vesiculosa TaxID=101127 RepID=A0A1X2GM05_9FUNG|nr:S-adenosyl-L-methionine-dependent methyltransferase [Hesseltinella vesiculosa]